MRLRSLRTILIILVIAFLSIEYEALLERKAYIEWVTSPRYQLEMLFASKAALRSAAYNKYDHFKLDCLGFGADMKLLQSMDKAGISSPFAENLRSQLYTKQFMLLERWFLFDHILYPGASDHTTVVYYYKHLKPRKI